MADWEKLNIELDDALNSMTSEDWQLWALKNVKKMENRKTEQKLSAEWLIDWMGKNQYFIGNDLLKAAERAKEMEKEKHEKFNKFLNDEKELGLSDLNTIERIQWYYNTYFNETFKSE
jgi:hypothetical protein